MLGALLIAIAAPAAAQTSQKPFEIVDNSFLVEEAFNQEPRIFQNIFGATRRGGDWQLSFTQEWPVPGIRHQLSYTVGFDTIAGGKGVSDVYLNYRFQLLEEGGGRPAFAPRISGILPSGRRSAGQGDSGLQINLPFSKQHNDWYFHWNGGLTWIPRGEREDFVGTAFAGSVVYRLRPMLNLMFESVAGLDDARALTLSPGIRGGWNLAEDTQLIVGAAAPITRARGETSAGVFGYLSYELPFRK